MSIGTEIRRLRQEKGLTLQQLADAAGVSTALISKVETGGGNPSINSVRKIAFALGVPTAFLFVGEDLYEQELVTVNQTQRYNYGGVETKVVVASTDPGLRFLTVKASPNAERGSRLFPHDPHNGFEQGIILSGQMELIIGGKTYLLKTGDSISFSSRLPHSWRNPGPEELHAAWVISFGQPD